MCGKAEAAVNPKSACKSRQICECVCVFSSCLKVNFNCSWVTQGNFPESFLSLSCHLACRQETAMLRCEQLLGWLVKLS